MNAQTQFDAKVATAGKALAQLVLRLRREKQATKAAPKARKP